MFDQETSLLAAKLAVEIREPIQPSFVESIYERLHRKWNIPTVDPIDVLGVAQLLRMQIDNGKVRRPKSLNEWRDAIADAVARLKLK